MRRGRSGEKTAEIGDPPVGDGELDDMFFSLVVDGKVAQTSACDKRQMPADVPLLKNELTLLECPGREERAGEFEFLFCELDSFPNMLAQYVKRWHGNG